MNNIFFDLDGTLWDATEQIANAWNNILEKNNLNIKLTKNDIKKIMGMTHSQIKKEIFYNKIHLDERLLEEFEKEEIKYLKDNGGILYQDVKKTLLELKNNNNLFIVSNCQDGYIEAFLDYYNFNNIFKDYICNGKTKKDKNYNLGYLMKKYNINTGFFIGDTISDYNAAKNNNLKFIFAKYGFGNIKTSKFYIDNFNEIKKIINN